jgi:hypothetical protein
MKYDEMTHQTMFFTLHTMHMSNHQRNLLITFHIQVENLGSLQASTSTPKPPTSTPPWTASTTTTSASKAAPKTTSTSASAPSFRTTIKSCPTQIQGKTLFPFSLLHRRCHKRKIVTKMQLNLILLHIPQT